MNRETDRLSVVLTEMSAKALVTWMTHSALHDIPREALLVRGHDFVYALHANFVLLRDVLSETLEDMSRRAMTSKKDWIAWNSAFRCFRKILIICISSDLAWHNYDTGPNLI